MEGLTNFLRLVFVKTRDGEPADSPITHIACEPKSLSYLRSAPNGDFIGWGCKGIIELEGLVKLLKSDLDVILLEAKGKYTNQDNSN